MRAASTTAGPATKIAYLGALLRSALRDGGLPESMVEDVVVGWLNLPATDEPTDGMIDHQSHLALPLEFGGRHPSKEFVHDFRDFLLRDDVAILGGNDNGDEPHHLLGRSTPIKIPLPEYGGLTARKDRLGFWTLFHPRTGGKVRFSFTDDSLRGVSEPYMASAPELVDMKITGYCPFAGGNGCNVPCYQASDRGGAHASLESVTAPKRKRLGFKGMPPHPLFSSENGGWCVAYPCACLC